MDDTLCNYTYHHKWWSINHPEIKYPQSQYGFFMELQPMKDAIRSYKLLDYHHDVWILTAPSYNNPMCNAEKNYWVRKHLGIEFTKKLIICNDKSLLKGDYLIDDSTGRGQENFEGKLITFGQEPYTDWNLVMEYFKNEYDVK